MQKLLSIVIPAWNEERTIEKLISKVLEIDLPYGYRKEIVLVNDYSIDNTLEIIRGLEKKI